MTRLVCVSDTHHRIKNLHPPDGDILIHAGDFSMMGRSSELTEFGNWLQLHKNRYKHRIVIAGNHDLMFEQDPTRARNFLDKQVTYLNDESITLEGIEFYGSPFSALFGGWAFMEDEIDLAARYAHIPVTTQVLITHGPAYGILDKTLDGLDVGSTALKSRLSDLTSLRVHINGHIHESYGQIELNGVKHINASVVDRRYMLVNEPIVVDI